MALLLWFILVVLLYSRVVSLIGTDTVAELLWFLYMKISPKKTVITLRQKKREAIEVYQERQRTSSMDNFAKWAKLNRKYDALQAEVSQLESSLSSTHAQFSNKVKMALRISTTGVKWAIRLYWRSTPLFYLPSGLFPPYIEWFLAFPFAPRGSISATAWMWAVDVFLGRLESVIKHLVLQPAPVSTCDATEVDGVKSDTKEKAKAN